MSWWVILGSMSSWKYASLKKQNIMNQECSTAILHIKKSSKKKTWFEFYREEIIKPFCYSLNDLHPLSPGQRLISPWRSMKPFVQLAFFSILVNNNPKIHNPCDLWVYIPTQVISEESTFSIPLVSINAVSEESHDILVSNVCNHLSSCYEIVIFIPDFYYS